MPPTKIGLTPIEAARILGVSVDWLRRGRHEGWGPAFCDVGHRTVRYLESDLRAWVESRRKTPIPRDPGKEAGRSTGCA